MSQIFDDRIKEQISAANDIVELINQYVPLKRSGRNFKACCPFHQEKSPSFMVNAEKQIFRCFGCGAGGDIFTFIMRYENLNFAEALRQLAERAHITLPVPTKANKQEASENEKLYEIYRLACDFYHQQFLHPLHGQIARQYFLSRQYDLETAKDFQIGWASENWKGLFEYMSKKGFPESLLLKSGLIHRSPKGPLYDAFRSRILFPIHNLQGKVVAFGGRILSKEKEGGPKYLNSPENPIFHKRRELFGLFRAKKFIDKEQPRILVTEGYFDFLRAFHSGFKMTVATLGTALSEEHVRLLKRFAEEAVVIYDGDKAGQAAALRGLEVFLEGGMSVRLVRMPEGYDPDDYLLKFGPEAFQKLIDEAQDFFDYKLDVLLERFNRWDSMGLIRITNEFMETLIKVKNSFLLDRYLRRLASSLGIDENSLRQELAKLRDKQKKNAPSASVDPVPKQAKKRSREEILLLSMIPDEASFRERIFKEIQETDFTDDDSRRLFQSLLSLFHQGVNLSWNKILELAEDPSLKDDLLGPMVFESNREEKQKVIEDCLEKIRLRRKHQEMETLRRLIAQAEREGDQSKMHTYVEAYQSLLRSK